MNFRDAYRKACRRDDQRGGGRRGHPLSREWRTAGRRVGARGGCAPGRGRGRRLRGSLTDWTRRRKSGILFFHREHPSCNTLDGPSEGYRPRP